MGTAWVAASSTAARGANGIPGVSVPAVTWRLLVAEVSQTEPFPLPVALSQCSKSWNLCFECRVELLLVCGHTEPKIVWFGKILVVSYLVDRISPIVKGGN